LERTFKVILDLFTVKFLTSFASKPIYVFGGGGLMLIIVSFFSLLFLCIRRFVAVNKPSPFASPLFIIAVMLAIMGFQSILMGLIAELLARTYHESQKKPVYIIREICTATHPKPAKRLPEHAMKILVISHEYPPIGGGGGQVVGGHLLPTG
jgi:hypothetical protein